MPKVVADVASNEVFQRLFAYELVGAVKSCFAGSEVSRQEAKRLTGDIAFALAAMFDGAGSYLGEGENEFRPVVAFVRPDEDQNLYYLSGAQYHERVDELVEFIWEGTKWESD